MGRFDSLKENAFSSTTGSATRGNDDKKNNNRQRDNKRCDKPKNGKPHNERDLIVGTGTKPNNDNQSTINSGRRSTNDLKCHVEPVVDNPVVDNPVVESNWLKAIKKREEDEKNQKNVINQHDPKYWRGFKWIGPLFMRRVTNNLEYSRDNVNWYDSWNATFSQEQLYNIQYQEEEDAWYESMKTLEEYSMDKQEESKRFYEEIGQFDELAVARLERIAYEKYAEQFENVDVETTPEQNDDDIIDSDDYLEDDY